MSQGGYPTNFGAGVGGGGIRGVEGQIMSHVLKPMVTRFVNSIKEIRSAENLVSKRVVCLLVALEGDFRACFNETHTKSRPSIAKSDNL